MSDTTLPNSPSAYAQFDNGDFARLIPRNRSAKIDFHDVVEKDVKGPIPNDEIGIYMNVNTEMEDESISASDTDSGQPPSTALWTGYFRLNMNIRPRNEDLGWVFGRGRKDMPQGGIDVKLTNNATRHVAGRHFRIFHNLSGALIIQTDGRKVVLDGKDELGTSRNLRSLDTKDDLTRAVTSPSTGISVGDLEYKLVFTKYPEYSHQLKDFLKAKGNPEPLVYLNPTPSGTDYLLQQYVIQPPFAQGSYGTVSPGYHRVTGNAVAIKRIKKLAETALSVEKEVDIIKQVFHEYIYEVKDILRIRSQTSSNQLEEIYLILAPLGVAQLTSVLTSKDVTVTDCIILFRQMIEAVAHIHSKDIMHRDINLENINIVTFRPPVAQLIDFGCATDKKTSRNHHVGTLRYLAPEVIDLKEAEEYGEDMTDLPAYDRSMDVWTLGLTFYEVFAKKRVTWISFSEEQFKAIQLQVDFSIDCRRPDQMAFCLIEHMLRTDPLERISAAKALTHCGGPLKPSSQSDAKSGMKRQRE